jgi:hypothetical protein
VEIVAGNFNFPFWRRFGEENTEGLGNGGGS